MLTLALVALLQDADAFEWARELDRLDLSARWGPVEVELGGELDLEVFLFEREAPGILVEDSAIRSDEYKRTEDADSPAGAGRFQLFLEGGVGESLEFLVEGRVDFTTFGEDGNAGARFEQYWLRWKEWPWLKVQAGKFAAPLGNFIPRHEPSKNPLTTWPLVYDVPTSFPSIGAGAAAVLANRDKPDRKDWAVPVWQQVYGTGAMVFGTAGEVDYFVALTNSAPGTLPEDWKVESGDYDPPIVCARVSAPVDISTRLGASWMRGPTVKKDAVGLPAGRERGDFPQTLAGIDAEFAAGDLDVFAELYWNRFEGPNVDDLELWAGYVEAKYTFLPGLFGAARVGRVSFGEIEDASGESRRWDRDLTRWEAGGGYFFTKSLFLKVTAQLTRHLGGSDPEDNLLMAQLGLKF